MSPDDPRPAGTPSAGPVPATQGTAGVFGWYGLAVLVILIDQVTKLSVLEHFRYGERASVIPDFFDLTLLFNPGAAFSFLGEAGGWQRWLFTGIAVCASIFIIVLLWRQRDNRLFSFALTMILGGALGNLIDRLEHGHVVDFLLFYHHPWYFPAFNAADSAITLGAILLIVDELLRWRRRGPD